jgi:hypothetical protein
MMPADAHVVAALSTPIVPPASARLSFGGTSAVSLRRKLEAIASIVAQKTDSTGEKPSSMNAMIDTSEPKWNQ